ncbi:NADH-quinone oxidoreductase subunit M [Thalassoglobus neptunius]|uniref:NADH-quinone oxidoreductase subunit M n=1 Tax=Thalassoglobus neptunius TaxID=1938619 RepID=A0A5C5WCV1_9PLAN|nr:proton-conducting transporter membrane subunit [Thalassoglobus neptunius]TWT47891.1 NADH-quinone oxidoreductase subunit M [Thalassoglobus neptunius]
MPRLHLPWLELSVVLPLLGAIFVFALRNQHLARLIGIVTCTLTLVCATGEWIDFGLLESFEAHDQWDFLERVLNHDVLVVDELSAPLLPLGAFLYFSIVVTTLRTKVNRFSFGWTLLSESLLMATLACRSPWLLIGLLSAATIPPWVELRQRGECTRVYVFHMGLFVALLVAGQLLVDASSGSVALSIIGGCLLTGGALIRNGTFPLHCWMTDLFENATFGTAILYVIPMTGAYTVMRLVFPIAPTWALQSIAVISLITAFYAACMSTVQQDARRFFCFIFLSNSALVLVGLEMVTPVGLTGALCVWISVGISLLGLGLILRCVEARIGRLKLNRFHGLYEQTPYLAGTFLLTGLASIGFPGTVGFIGTELLVEGAVDVYPLVGFTVVLATTLNGIAALNAYFRIFTGTHHQSSVSIGCRPPERIIIVVLSLMMIGGGLVPQPGIDSRYHAAKSLLEHRNLPVSVHTLSENDTSPESSTKDSGMSTE